MIIPTSQNWVQFKFLPHVDEVIDFLSSELPPLCYWLSTAVEYYRQGSPSSYEKILKTATSDEIEKLYQESKEEKISMLNRLAAYYFGMAFACSDISKRDDLFNSASNYIRAAEGKDIRAEINMICKGFLLLAQNKIESANANFENAITAKHDNVLALLGLACISFQNKEYSKALAIYSKVIRINHKVPPNVRLGLAFCHYKLGNKDLAFKSLRRVLDMQANNADALIALAVLEYEKGNYEEYLRLLVESYKANTSHPLVNLHLARHYFYQKDYEKSIKLAEFSLNRIKEGDKQTIDISKMRCECFYTIGQCYHAQGDYENAFRFYTQASRQDGSFILVQFALGQMHLNQKDISKACQCFESVLEKHPSNYETLKILGSIYTKQHKKEQALEKLNQVVKANPDDAEAWIEIAQLLEISKPKQALEAYEKALANISNPPAELWNNIAILRHKTGDQEGAAEAYGKIQEKKKTMIYNKARWHEDNGRLDQAEELYNEVLAEQARYSDALLRLAIINKKRGDYSKALEYTRKAISIEKKPINALCQKGCLEAELGETKKSLETFHKVINEHSHNDIYATLALGNLHYEIAMTSREGAEKNFQKSIQYFLKVVDMDEYNCYAAIGVAMILAENGDLKQSLDVFKQVFDIQPTLDFLLVNRATILMVQGQLDQAVKFYRKAWEKSAIDKEIIGTYLAFAYFIAGKFTDCVEILKQVNKSATNQLNIGLVFHEHAVYLLKKDNRDIEDTKLAILKIEEALKAYEEVVQTKWEPRIGIESRQEDKRKIEWSIKKAYDKIENAKRLQEDTSIYLQKDLEKVRGESARVKDYLKIQREDSDEGPQKHLKAEESPIEE